MSSLLPIFKSGEPTGDIVFVHGLGGDPHKTWGFDHSNSWMNWLSVNRPDLNIWSLEYRVERSEWTGGSMPLSDRALNVLALLDNKSIGLLRPIVFICHSFGGLLVKELLRHALTTTKKFQYIVQNTKGVIFFATPHAGSSIADLANYLSFFLHNSVSVAELSAQNPRLRDLNLWFRNNYDAMRLKPCIFYETKNTRGVRVVNETSSDPGIPLVSPIPIDADHFSICRPDSYDNIAVGQTIKFIDECIPSQLHRFTPDNIFVSDSAINNPLPPSHPLKMALIFTAAVVLLVALAFVFLPTLFLGG
jgi:hypothetical protein